MNDNNLKDPNSIIKRRPGRPKGSFKQPKIKMENSSVTNVVKNRPEPVPKSNILNISSLNHPTQQTAADCEMGSFRFVVDINVPDGLSSINPTSNTTTTTTTNNNRSKPLINIQMYSKLFNNQ